MLKEIGLLFPRAIGARFRTSVLELIREGHPLRPLVDGLLAVHDGVERQPSVLDKRVRDEAKADQGVPSHLGDPTRFRSPRRSAPTSGSHRDGSNPASRTAMAVSRNGATECCGPTCSRWPLCCCTGHSAGRP